MDNAKVIETLEKQTLFNYFEKLITTRIRKITLFSIFPYTSAPNLSDPRYFVMLEDLSKIVYLNSGRLDN